MEGNACDIIDEYSPHQQVILPGTPRAEGKTRSRAVAFFRQVSKSFEKSISTATSGGSSIRHYASPNLSMDVPTITTSTIPPPTSTETREEVQVFSTGVRRRGPRSPRPSRGGASSSVFSSSPPYSNGTTLREPSSTSASSSSHTTPSPRRSATSSTRHSTEDVADPNTPNELQPSIGNNLTNNTLSVPPVSYGAIPRTTIRTSTQTDQGEAKRCFCGYYQETTGAANTTGKKPGRCKFCRSKAKYVPGQRSFDAAGIFGRRREQREPRRAVSEDQQRETTSDNDRLSSRSSFFSRHPQVPFLHRQDRLVESDGFPSQMSYPGGSPGRDHGLQTPPGPPGSPHMSSSSSILTSGFRSGRRLMDDDQHSRMLTTHRMAYEMSEYLTPPVLCRAQTDPTSTYETRRPQPTSPPPTYEEVMKEPRVPPPSYEEALSSRVRISNRSQSEERTMATGGAHPSPPPAFRSSRGSSSGTGAGAARILTRSRAEDIPDIYWEQAARELDFCTCRKCQARYRLCFEEDPDLGDALIPMETQVLMQEVLTDGIAFCSLM